MYTVFGVVEKKIKKIKAVLETRGLLFLHVWEKEKKQKKKNKNKKTRMRQISFQFYYYIQNYLVVYKGKQKVSPLKSRHISKLYTQIFFASNTPSWIPKKKFLR